MFTANSMVGFVQTYSIDFKKSNKEYMGFTGTIFFSNELE